MSHFGTRDHNHRYFLTSNRDEDELRLELGLLKPPGPTGL